MTTTSANPHPRNTVITDIGSDAPSQVPRRTRPR